MVHVKDVIKEVLTASKKPAELIEAGMGEIVPGKGFTFKPVSSYEIVYDSAQNQLEPIYYWILDFLQGFGLQVEKITDNFMSSPGSGHFAEMGQRATRMQEEGMKILGGLNQVIKSALNLVYDLKEFKLRLQHYDDLRSKDKNVRHAAELALKQVWLDSVDLPKRQTGSIHQMAAQLGYTTIREAFMVAESTQQVREMAKEKEGVINEAVARILEPRLKEFYDWVKYSEHELRKRYNIEKSYLKSQVGTIKLYSAWVKPYLKAAEELRQQGFDRDAALVNAFSTSMFQLTLLTKGRGEKSKNREYIPVMVIDFKYRAHLLQRVTQRGDYAPQFGGRVEMTFDSYCLNNEEYDFVKAEIEKRNVQETLTLEGDYATDALKELEEDLREFLGDESIDKLLEKDRKKDDSKNGKKKDDINPFYALYTLIRPLWGGDNLKQKKGEPPKEAKLIKKDNWTEKQLRVKVAQDASDKLYTVYDVYKKAHGMASTPQPFENTGGLDEPTTRLSDVWSRDWQ